MRGTLEAHQVLYSGDMPGHSGMVVELTLTNGAAAHWTIEVQLTGRDLAPMLHVQIGCGADTRTTSTDATGAASFDVPAAWITDEHAPDLQVNVAAV